MPKIFLFCILFIFLIHPASLQAEENLNLDHFSEIAILHEGRVKPLESYALSIFRQFSDNKINSSDVATSLLAKTIFTPEKAVQENIFYIEQPHQYGLSDVENNLYSYTQILSIIENNRESIPFLTTKKNLTAAEQSFLTLASHQIFYGDLLRSLTALIPIHISDKETLNFIDLKDNQNRQKIISKIKKSNGDISQFNEQDQKEIVANFAFDTIAAGGKNNDNFKVIKAYEGNEWFSPWQIILRDNQNRYEQILQHWQNLSIAYRENKASEFNDISHVISPLNHSTKIKFENFYNAINFLNIAFISFLLVFAGLNLVKSKSNFLPRKILQSLFFIGILFLTAQILGRVFIMERPPVGTLYESILFVALITSFSSFFLSLIKKENMWLLIGSISTIGLIGISYFFAQEDDMRPLVAVLNSNFWLMTHVLIITAGYGLCLISSVYAHILLFRSGEINFKTHNKNVIFLSVISLFLITFGTILGGLWADQSWGRFWGWDPKENGALLILLWISWLLHARLTHYSSERLFLTGIAFLSVIVAVAWFGVNLLNVGLHSYGFTEGIFWGLVGFCLIEIAIISGLYLRGKNGTSYS